MERYEYDALLQLVGAVFERAIIDARRGRTDAVWFLDHTLPEWRRVGRARKGESRSQGQIGQQTNKQRNGDIPMRSPLEQTERG